jgi:hypothetical protein
VALIFNNIEDIQKYEECVTMKNVWRTHKTKAVGALEGTDTGQPTEGNNSRKSNTQECLTLRGPVQVEGKLVGMLNGPGL